MKLYKMKSTIKKYLEGKSPAEEQRRLLEWLRKEKHLSEFQRIKQEWKTELVKEETNVELVQDWNSIQKKILNTMQSEIEKKNRMLGFLRYAAVLLALVLVPSLIFIFSGTGSKTQLVYTTIAADYGQISKAILPDGSEVWINSGSTIKYNNQFSATNRDIELVGEAFLKVKKNKNLPLFVNCSGLSVKVLGTEFCVSAYPEEPNIHVVLEKGKVELTSASNARFRQEMNPGELAYFNKEKNELAIRRVNTNLYTSWKDGTINIYNLPLSELVVKLEKRYNQKFEVDDEIKNLPYTFTIKNENLSYILGLMERITPVDVVQKENSIALKYNKKKTKP